MRPRNRSARFGERRSVQSWERAAHEWARHVRGGGDKAFEWNAPRFFELVPSPLGRAVEIGCGEGRVTRELKAQGYDVLAFDVSETLVELAREADPAGEYAVADAAALPIANGVAQLVIAFNVLNELAQLRETVAPLADYMAALAAARLLVEALREVPTVIRAPGRLPAYLHLRAVKR